MEEEEYAMAQTMAKCGKDKIAEAKKRLREVLNFEEVKRLLKGRIFNIKQYNEYINNIERFVFLILESYISTNNVNP
ncbi:MAG: hypothetical protein GQ574_08405 [Crocinitomix sp.]|nr:hypothetical protein [Crocinitomix sp.]